jgi:hypothetical protein
MSEQTDRTDWGERKARFFSALEAAAAETLFQDFVLLAYEPGSGRVESWGNPKMGELVRKALEHYSRVDKARRDGET